MELHLKSSDGDDIYETGVASFVSTDSGVTLLYEEPSDVSGYLLAEKEHLEGAEVVRGRIEGKQSYEEQAEEVQTLQDVSEKVGKLADAGELEEEISQEMIHELIDDEQKREQFLNREF